jgi:DNA sulfur modification protein DndC
MLLQSIEATRLALIDNPNAHWVIAFSGGKDSSAVIKIFLAAYRKLKNPNLKISLVYCDTGVENIVLDNYVKDVLRNLQFEFEAKKIPIRVAILEAPVFSRFFVRIIGRGYPPPTNNFRWCTKFLRIKPVTDFIDRQATDGTRAKAILVLGLRRNESQQRDRSLKNVRDVYWEKLRLGHSLVNVFTPIIEFSLEDVWDTIFFLDEPTSIVAAEIERIYRDASGECPVIKGPTAPPCSSGRFGCWTCTVVRKDKSNHELIKSGHSELRPFLEFRNWLAEFRNVPENRWPCRRSGQKGMGPFSLEARKNILSKVNHLETLSNRRIILPVERKAIEILWSLDHIPRVNFRSLAAKFDI